MYVIWRLVQDDCGHNRAVAPQYKNTQAKAQSEQQKNSSHTHTKNTRHVRRLAPLRRLTPLSALERPVRNVPSHDVIGGSLRFWRSRLLFVKLPTRLVDGGPRWRGAASSVRPFGRALSHAGNSAGSGNRRRSTRLLNSTLHHNSGLTRYDATRHAQVHAELHAHTHSSLTPSSPAPRRRLHRRRRPPLSRHSARPSVPRRRRDHWRPPSPSLSSWSAHFVLHFVRSLRSSLRPLVTPD